MRHKLIVELKDGSFRPATGPEAKAARKAEAERLELESQIRTAKDALRKIEATCHHLVCQDKESYIYNIRCCLRCGNQSLL
jgi:hypothetical protein